ncbi:hypothetical protein [Flavisericum labens]|uniref:hypothetical protein n=1 Tax=Flavisericum labens TaxID=3377112 RepID=UPI00387B87F1
MKFNDISFPHPVLGLGDAIFGSVDLGNPEINSMQDVYEIKINCKHDNNDLKALIIEDKAEFLFEVTCTNTLFRKLFLSNKGKIEFEIPKKEVKGKVEFICLLVTKKNIFEYSNKEAHPDYYGYTFDLDQGDVLAYFGKFSFNADIKYEKLKAVSSFMEIVENEDLKFTNFDLKKNKIEIQLPTETYNIYRSDFISQDVKFVPVFHSSIVLNALLTALYNLDEHKDYLWAKVIDYRLKEEKQFKFLDIAEKENIPEIAQRLLGNPFKRLLEGLNVIIESENEE